VSLLLVQVGWQIDDGDCLEGALFDADTASDTKLFTDESDFAGGFNFDAELSWC
jgi:hypothetical protein